MVEGGAPSVLDSPNAWLDAYAVHASGDVLATWHTNTMRTGKGAFVWFDSSGTSRNWSVPAGQNREVEMTTDGFLLRPNPYSKPKRPVVPVLVDGAGDLVASPGHPAGEVPTDMQLGTWTQLFLESRDSAGRRWAAEPWDFDRTQRTRWVSWWWPGRKDERRTHVLPFFTDVRAVAGDDIAFFSSEGSALVVEHSADGGQHWRSLSVDLATALDVRVPRRNSFPLTAVTDDGTVLGGPVGRGTYFRVSASRPTTPELISVPQGFTPPQASGDLVYCERLFDDSDLPRDMVLAVSDDHGDSWRMLDLRGTKPRS